WLRCRALESVLSVCPRRGLVAAAVAACSLFANDGLGLSCRQRERGLRRADAHWHRLEGLAVRRCGRFSSRALFRPRCRRVRDCAAGADEEEVKPYYRTAGWLVAMVVIAVAASGVAAWQASGQ